LPISSGMLSNAAKIKFAFYRYAAILNFIKNYSNKYHLGISEENVYIFFLREKIMYAIKPIIVYS
jgi:hemerythrin-like domain-containing protein